MVNKYEIYSGFEWEITNPNHLEAALELIRRNYSSGVLRSDVFGINLPIFIAEEINKMLDERIFKLRQEFIVKANYDWGREWLIKELEGAKERLKAEDAKGRFEIEELESTIKSSGLSGEKDLTAKIFDHIPGDDFRQANALEMANFRNDFSYFAKRYNVVGRVIGDFYPCTYRTYIESHRPSIALDNAFLSFSRNPRFATQWDGYRIYFLGIKLQ